MTKRQDRDAIQVKRQFDTEIIVLCVRWYIAAIDTPKSGPKKHSIFGG